MVMLYNTPPEFGDRYYVKNVIILSTDGQDVTAVEMDILTQKDLLVRQPNNAAGETEIIPITPTADFRPYVKLVVLVVLNNFHNYLFV